jgi:DsbC/DsbD-like thiol-disulfide interchange protein
MAGARVRLQSGARYAVILVCLCGEGRAKAATATSRSPPDATLACEPARAPGRVRCSVEARVAPGESIAWGDVVLTAMPPFATALRGRIGPHDATVRSDVGWRWEFAVAARAKGRGRLEGRVRLVVCQAKACLPVQADVSGELVVGELGEGDGDAGRD